MTDGSTMIISVQEGPFLFNRGQGVGATLRHRQTDRLRAPGTPNVQNTNPLNVFSERSEHLTLLTLIYNIYMNTVHSRIHSHLNIMQSASPVKSSRQGCALLGHRHEQ